MKGETMRTFMMLFSTLLLLRPAWSAPQDGRAIMQKVLQGSNWQDMQADVTLTVTNSRGQQRVRKIKLYSRDRTENESDMLMRFTAPADVAGTGFLVIEHAGRDDDRYLYLPALRRTKRIASSGKGGNFMGSDYTYYDIGEPKLGDWTYPEGVADTLDGVACYKITALPATPQIEKDTNYSKLVHWVRKDRMTVIQTEYYDRRGKLLKVLTIPEMVQLDGVWFQSHLVMKNVQDNRSSEMRFENIEINTGLSADLFSKRQLERRR